MAAAGIADLLGRRRVFVFGLALFTVGSLLCAIAPSADALIAFRVVQAIGAAFLVPSALALVLNAFPPAQRSHGVALLSAVGAAAAGLGPSLGGLLVSAANWRLVFLVNIPIGVAAALLARAAAGREPGAGPSAGSRPAGHAAVRHRDRSAGARRGQGPGMGLGQRRIIGCLAVALAFGAVVIWRCRRHRSPVLDLSLLRIRTVSVANAMMVIGAAGFYGYTLANVLFLTGVWRYSVLQAGLALTVGPLVAVAVAGPASRLAQRIGPRPVLVAGGLLWGGAVLWFVERVGTTPDFAGQWLPGMVLLGIGAGTTVPEPQRHRGRLGTGRQLRDGDRDEFCRAPGRSRARRGGRRGDHRDADAGDQPTRRFSMPGRSVRSACSSPGLAACSSGTSRPPRRQAPGDAAARRCSASGSRARPGLGGALRSPRPRPRRIRGA